MNHGVDAAVNFVDAGEGLNDLAVVGEIGANKPGSAVRGGDAVEVHNGPSLVDERCDNGTAEFAAAAGHCRRSLPLFEPAVPPWGLRWFGDRSSRWPGQKPAG
jgi:hypothetical protein